MESDRGAQLSHVGRLLLDEAQRRFPVCARPYAELGRRLGLDEARVIRLLGAYRQRGIVRRIGPRYDARAFGLDTVLVALSVTPGKVREAAARINALEGVTHNYLRRHPLNIWFTLASTGRAARGKELRALALAIRPRRLIELPATRLFKLGVLFDLGVGGEKREERPGAGETASRKERTWKIPPGSRGQSRGVYLPPTLALPLKGGGGKWRKPSMTDPVPPGIVSLIPADLTPSRSPFPPGAVAAVRGFLASGRMRRFGAVLDGKALGYRYNALVAWRVPRGMVDEAGRLLAAFGAVSHCYARAAKRAWPYRLYTMVHARDRRGGIRLIGEMSRVARDDGHAVLETVRALKRSRLNPGAVLFYPK